MPLSNKDFPYLFNKRFLIQERLGEGGMGSVFKAIDQTLKKVIAIKVLTRDFDDRQVVRFQQEARAIARLNHLNIVEVYDFAQSDDGQFFLTMEHVNGLSLEEFLSKAGALSFEELLPVINGLLDGLDHAHQNHVLHRDIKPSNVMLMPLPSGGYQVKLVDFGLAKMSEEEQALTATGLILGSPYYMSPEQIAGSKIDERSDIYSFGCLIYRALTGSVPFSGVDALSTMAMHKGKVASPFSEIAPDRDIPVPVEQFVFKCMAKSPSDRFQSVNELQSELNSIIEDLKTTDNPLDLSKSKTKKALDWKIVGVVISFLLIGAGYAMLGFYGKPDTEPKDKNRVGPNGKKVLAHRVSPLPEYDEQVEESQIVEGNPTIRFDSAQLSVKAYKKIGSMKNIKRLLLNGCNVDNEAMKYITQSSSVVDLKLTDIEGITPESFNLLARMKHLSRLYINRMVLTNRHIEVISNMENLAYLDISNNDDIDSGALKYLKKLPNLKRIVFGNAKLTLEEIVPFVNSSNSITELGIGKFAKKSPSFELLSRLEKVDVMDFDRNTRLSPETFACIVKMPRLNILSLTQTSSPSSSLLYLKDKKSLSCLDVSKNGYNDLDVENLGKLVHVRQLLINENLITDKGIAKLKRLLPNCKIDGDSHNIPEVPYGY